MWTWVLLACAIAFATKLSGYLVPHEQLERPQIKRVTAVLTVGLLAALTAIQTFADGQALRLDARAVALVVAAVLLWCKAPYIVVVIGGAAAAALARLAGLP